MRSQDDGDVVGLSGAACPQAGFTRAQQMGAGPSLCIEVDSGMTRTVVALSCRFREAGETTITGLRPLFGGSV